MNPRRQVDMKGDSISIIIPVYNGEIYLERCLKSVIKQTYTNLEIIIINDGSTDCTSQICKAYESLDSRIVYIEQENHGVSYTRRRAIRMAKGKYIGFVDADDYIEENLYEKMVSEMADAQLLITGYRYQKREIYGAVPFGSYRTKEEKKYLYENMLLWKDTNQKGVYPSLWSKLFVANILKNVAEEVRKDLFIGEDADLLFRYLLLCDSVVVSSICLYNYEDNKASVMNSLNMDYLRNMTDLYQVLADEFAQTSYKESLIPKWNLWIWEMLQKTPQFMGWTFLKEPQTIRYICPFFNRLQGKKVILYGAGAVGKDYYRLCQKDEGMQVILWVDKNWECLQEDGWKVQPISDIHGKDYDLILIAVKDKEKAEEIKSQLQKLAIDASRILWKKPIQV